MKESAGVRTIAGKYELEKLLGQGGMGEVWVAKELSSGRKLALKLLKSTAADSKENRARFEREAHIATTLVSPHIAQVTDSGVDEEGEPFMAMELLHGEDLQQRIKTEKTLPLAQVVRLAIEVGRALHVAHAAGMVHRDLKPANIFLAQQGDDETVKVLDFGIAKAVSLGSTEYTAAGAMLGTASYMSPEQIRSAKTVDHRADLWAFAVVLFRSLTGQFPFEQTGFELFLALMDDPIPSPQKVTSLVPSLPAPLNVFFERSFVRDLSQRYPTASAAVVGFCRAAGVTVPADVLHAAAAPKTGAPTSTPLPSPLSAPASTPLPSSISATVPISTPLPSSISATVPLSGLPELDASDPDAAATVFLQPSIELPPPPRQPFESRGPSSASHPRPVVPGNAALGFGGPPLAMENPRRSYASLPALSAAPADLPVWQNVPPPPAPSRTWLWLVIGVVLALAAGALFFFLRPA